MTINSKITRKSNVYLAQTVLIFLISHLIIGCASDNVFVKKTYFDKEWNSTKSNDYEYYRICENDTINSVVIAKYFYKNGKLESVKHFKSPKLKVQTGKSISYFKTGNVKSEYNYFDNQLNGDYNLYYESGEVESVGSYLDGKLNGENYYYYKNGQPNAKLLFENGKKIKESFWDENGAEVNNTREYKSHPDFSKGIENFVKEFHKNLKIPSNIKRKGVVVSIVVELLISKEGVMQDVVILSSSHQELNEPLINAIKSVKGEWNPENYHYRLIDSSVKFPVNFKF